MVCIGVGLAEGGGAEVLRNGCSVQPGLLSRSGARTRRLRRAPDQVRAICATPFMYGRSAVGTVTDPSAS